MSTWADVEVWARRARGTKDLAAFDGLARAVDRPLRRFVAKSLVHIDASQLDDVMQAIHLAIWTGLAEFKGDSTFKTWCFSIAHNKIADAARTRSRRPYFLADDDEPSGY